VEPEQAFLFNGRPDNWIDVRIDFWRHGSSPTLPLTTFMPYSDIVLRGCAVPMCAARNIFGRFRRWPKKSADFALLVEARLACAGRIRSAWPQSILFGHA
jgi:hypothetical protein